MEELNENVGAISPNESKDLVHQLMELGSWMGRREAFAIIAGRCTAADVEVLRRMREERKYRSLDCTWAQFCTDYLKVSRRSADRMIGHLEEFGPAYFHLSKLTHITVSEYRQIAANVTEAGLELNGSVVALLPENAEKLSAAVTELLQRAEAAAQSKQLEAGPAASPESAPEAAAEPPAPPPTEPVTTPPSAETPVAERVLAMCRELTRLFWQVGSIDRETQNQFFETTWNMVHAARRNGLCNYGS